MSPLQLPQKGWADPDVEPVVTLASHIAEYARTKWAQWEPTPRRNALRDLSRACIYLVADDAPELTAADRAAIDATSARRSSLAPRPLSATKRSGGPSGGGGGAAVG